jgi:hypothetical protein
LSVLLQRGWSELQLIQGKIATLTAQRFTITIDDNEFNNTTIKQLKEMIETQQGIPVENQELRRGKTKMKDENNLSHYHITENTTILLINNGAEYEFYENVEEGDSVKAKERPRPAQTVTLTEDEAKRLNPENLNWWELSNVQSGPRNTRRLSVTDTSDHPSTTPQQLHFCGTVGGRSNNNNVCSSPESRREFMRRIAEGRLRNKR